MLALRLILKDKGGKQHCLSFVGSNLRIEIFLKKKEHQEKRSVEIEGWGTSVHFVLGFQENSMESLSAFLMFFANKKNSKNSIYFTPWFTEFLSFIEYHSFPIYKSNSRKRYALKLLPMCLGRSTLSVPLLGVKSTPPPSIPSLIP